MFATTHSPLLGFCSIWIRPVRCEQLPSYQQDCLEKGGGSGDTAQWLWSVNQADKAHFIFLDKYILHHDVRE